MAKRLADRARALAASTSRFLGGAVETSSSSRCCVACAISSTARLNTASLALEGFDTPAIFRTYCNAASCTSALVAAGSKLFKGLIFRHIPYSIVLRFDKFSLLDEAPARHSSAAWNFGAAALCSVGLTGPASEAKNA